MEGFEKISLHDLADRLKDGMFELTDFIPEEDGALPTEWYCPRTQYEAEEWLKDTASLCNQNGDHATFILKMSMWVYIIRRYDDKWEYLEVVL